MSLKEAFLIQISKKEYLLGEGPLLRLKRASKNSLYLPGFFLNEKKAFYKPSKLIRLSPFDLEKLLNKQKGEFLFSSSKKVNFCFYSQVFHQIKQEIKKGNLEKGVPIFFEEGSLKDLDPLFLLKTLFKNTKNRDHGWLYAFWTKDKGILGFTPERLFKKEGWTLKTHALAGTKNLKEGSLLKDKKELKEHRIVVKGLRESLKDLGDLKKEKLEEVLFPPLKHLQTRLLVHLKKETSFQTIVEKLHPSPALSGYPKDKSLSFVKKNTAPVKLYASPFCFIKNSHNVLCLLALRGLEWEKDQVKISSGAGIVEESHLQKEWRELYLKRHQIKSFFKL